MSAINANYALDPVLEEINQEVAESVEQFLQGMEEVYQREREEMLKQYFTKPVILEVH